MVKSLLDHWARPLIFVLLLVGATLACNSPSGDADDAPTKEESGKQVLPTREDEKPTDTPLPEQDLGAPATVPIVGETPEEESPEAEQPEDTPTVEIPTLAPTITATSTSTRRPAPTNTPVPAGTSDGSGTPTSTPEGGNDGPLTFHFYIEWRPHPTDPMESIATVTIQPSGGGGGYSYYMGGVPVDGPIFEYTWRNCYGNPQSLTVTSADGQSMTQDYFENPPCPTATPTPT